jgi:RNA polymerase sigma-70 factor, ECF subfamily
VSAEWAVELINFDEALNELEKLSKRQSRVVELRYFGAERRGNSDGSGSFTETVRRDWSMARAWLHRALSPSK